MTKTNTCWGTLEVESTMLVVDLEGDPGSMVPPFLPKYTPEIYKLILVKLKIYDYVLHIVNFAILYLRPKMATKRVARKFLNPPLNVACETLR
jgi:hypothetical protein